MKKMRVLFLLMIVVILATLWTPAAASTGLPATGSVVLTINNRSVGPVTIKMTGPGTYSVYAAVGVMTKTINKGMYKVEYKACGVNKKVTLNANSGKAKLTIAPCQMAKIQVINQGSSTLYLTLSGPTNYRFSIPGHTVQLISVMKGTYNWTASLCGDTHRGTYTFSGKKRWTFWCY